MSISISKMPKIIAGIYDDVELRRTTVPSFISNPGLGKTSIVYQFAKERGVNVFEFITSQRNPFEISGMPMPDHDRKIMTIFDYDMIDSMKDGDILFFDELTNGNVTTLNACLTLLESRKTISGKDLPNIMIIAACNPQGSTPMTPQIKQRFVWYDVKFNEGSWSAYMFQKYSITSSMAKKFSELIKAENFNSSNLNYITPRSVDKAVNMILKGVDTGYQEIAAICNELIHFEKDFEVENVNGVIEKIPAGKHISWLNLKQFGNGTISKL